MSSIKEAPILEQVSDNASTNIDPSVLPPEPHPHPPIPWPDPTGIALLFFAIVAISEGASRAISGKS